MKPIGRILVTTDFSETSYAAFDLAREVAGRFEASIVLLHVLDAQLPPLVFETSGIGVGQFEKARADQSESRIKEAAARLGPDVETLVVCGTPHIEIVRIAEDKSIDLIVIATHGRGFLSHAILGSTAERVVRRAGCPVLTVRDRKT
jgi:nucleotide-binding universal stress UspA family protein